MQFVLGNFEAVVIDNSVAAVTLENEALLFAFFIVFATVMTSVFTIYWVGQIFVWAAARPARPVPLTLRGFS